MMEEIAFSEWPDLSGSNPWLPAYGFQPPQTLLDKDDFAGHPDADLFFNGNVSQQYMYLETIQEETSDDLQSESDRSGSRTSPEGWLATDSESGSVIRINALTLDDVDSGSEREIACPAKRRRQDNTTLNVYSDDDSNHSLSRSSSLLQFETLEKQCQDISSSSPSILSFFSVDSLEQRKNDLSPDSLDRDVETESDYYKHLKVDVPRAKRQSKSRDSLLATRYSDSDSAESSDSDRTLEAIDDKAPGHPRTSRSSETLHHHARARDKVSAENLSEDSGYSDHCNSFFTRLRSCSNPNLSIQGSGDTAPFTAKLRREKTCKLGTFAAYNMEGFFGQCGSSFGSSCQDLTALDAHARNGGAAKWVNLDGEPECAAIAPPKYSSVSASEPNLVQGAQAVVSQCESVAVHVASVPKDLNLAGLNRDWERSGPSIAATNCDLTDFEYFLPASSSSDESDATLVLQTSTNHPPIPSQSSAFTTFRDAMFHREGSYFEAMHNRIDLSDDEHNPCYVDNITESTITEFDKRILKTISETSIQSLGNSQLDLMFPDVPALMGSSQQRRNVVSTPDLSALRLQPQKGVLVNRSTSTSGMSDEDKTLTTTKSLSGSTSSKGVHFCPVVDEVNWGSSESNRDSSSLSSTPEREMCPSVVPGVQEKKQMVRAQQSRPRPKSRPVPPKLPKKFTSEPELQNQGDDSSDDVEHISEKVCVLQRTKSQTDTFHIPMRPRGSVSQPELARRGSLIMRRDSDGSVMRAYVDQDGIQYKHTHLGDIYTTLLPTAKKDTELCYVDRDGIRYEHSFLHTTGSGSAATTNTTSTTTSGQPASTKSSAAAPVADGRANMQEVPRKEKGKLGGFLSRLASFRFSKEKSKKKTAARGGVAAAATPVKNGSTLPPGAPVPKLATRDDYIYIPLKGPTEGANGTRAATNATGGAPPRPPPQQVAAKPPLPRLPPPRVVGASAKKLTASSRVANTTIDCTVAAAAAGESRPRRRPMEPTGLIETDLDTEVTTVVDPPRRPPHAKTRSLMDLGADAADTTTTTPRRQHAAPGSSVTHHPQGDARPARPHKSMEFLLDKQNLKVVEPPENELQKGERVMSENQLRIQRSLQKLTIPEWYKQSPVPREGFLLRKTASGRERWTGTCSKTPSMSSLGSTSHSPVLLSPIPHAQQQQPFVRWSTSKLNSTASSPCASTRSSFNTPRPHNGSLSPSSARGSFSCRQPYMGWRSQERLTKPRTPAERLANTLLNQHEAETPEIQTSIKEVTSAIVHYVSGLRPEEEEEGRSASTSPRGSQRLCWLESSFVGSRPLDTPQTPIALEEGPANSGSLRLDLHSSNDDIRRVHSHPTKPSPGSTTLEDVLDSLLGLPASTRAPSPSSHQETSANTSPSRLGEASRAAEHFRRHSEGSDRAKQQQPSGGRRVSFHSSPVLRCRNARCDKVVSAASDEARLFRKCHNCTYSYCSRTCRRAHWDHHRRTCLFSRVGTLCRQVLAATRAYPQTLKKVSAEAQRGFLAQGRGAVKCFFPCPEMAEQFLEGGLENGGEITYVRWPDLQPTEMGPHLYSELVKMCKNYNPTTKLILYACICVVSEAPSSGAGKWERQLVSRCAKMRLNRDALPIPLIVTEDQGIAGVAFPPPETVVLPCTPPDNAQSPHEPVFSDCGKRTSVCHSILSTV